MPEHHNLLAIPRHFYKFVSIKGSTVHRDKGSGGNYTGDAGFIFMEPGEDGILYAVSSDWHTVSQKA